MLKLDHHYVMGRAHRVCEDYALQGEAWVAVADGCSSSPDTDIGARLLCRLAHKHLQRGDLPEDYESVGALLSTEAARMAEWLGVGPGALDATLLLGVVRGRTVQVYVYGDGCILLRHRDGSFHHVEVNFTTNAPYYLSYWPDPERQALYADRLGYQDTLMLSVSRTGSRALYPHTTPMQFDFSLDEYPLVALASDGAGALVEVAAQRRLPLAEVAASLVDFQSLQGEFVKRRLPKLLNRYAEQGIMALDDVALAVIVEDAGDAGGGV